MTGTSKDLAGCELVTSLELLWSMGRLDLKAGLGLVVVPTNKSFEKGASEVCLVI